MDICVPEISVKYGTCESGHVEYPGTRQKWTERILDGAHLKLNDV